MKYIFMIMLMVSVIACGAESGGVAETSTDSLAVDTTVVATPDSVSVN